MILLQKPCQPEAFDTEVFAALSACLALHDSSAFVRRHVILCHPVPATVNKGEHRRQTGTAERHEDPAVQRSAEAPVTLTMGPV